MDKLLEKRKLYFAFLFSSFIFFALLIILRVRIDLSVVSYPIYLISLFSILPAYLLFNRKLSFKKQLVIGYIPIIAGFLISLIFNNSIYFLISYPVFLLNYIIIVPRR